MTTTSTNITRDGASAASAGDDFSARIHAVLPRIRERREEIERARRLPRDLVDEISATGIFRFGVPRAYGGDEAEFPDFLRVIETVAAADGSTGWCVANGMLISMTPGFMKEDGVREVFADISTPRAFVVEPAGAAVEEEGGIRLSGRWRFASNVTHVDWIGLGCMIMEGGKPRMTEHGPEIRHVFVPVSEIEIHDTWHVSGLCGTGSFDVSCKDVFVPARRVFSVFAPDARPEPLYQLPVLAPVASFYAAVSLGIGRAALDELIAHAPSKLQAMTMIPLTEKPVAQVEIARAEGELSAARSYLYDTVDDMWQTVSAGGTATLRQEALLRIASNQAVEVAARVAQTAARHAGASAIFDASPFQRHMRDTEVLTHHMITAPHWWEDAGRVLMGLQPIAPLF